MTALLALLSSLVLPGSLGPHLPSATYDGVPLGTVVHRTTGSLWVVGADASQSRLSYVTDYTSGGTGFTGELHVLDLRTGEDVIVAVDVDPETVQFNPNGDYVTYSTGRQPPIYDAELFVWSWTARAPVLLGSTYDREALHMGEDGTVWWSALSGLHRWHPTEPAESWSESRFFEVDDDQGLAVFCRRSDCVVREHDGTMHVFPDAEGLAQLGPNRTVSYTRANRHLVLAALDHAQVRVLDEPVFEYVPNRDYSAFAWMGRATSSNATLSVWEPATDVRTHIEDEVFSRHVFFEDALLYYTRPSHWVSYLHGWTPGAAPVLLDPDVCVASDPASYLTISDDGDEALVASRSCGTVATNHDLYRLDLDTLALSDREVSDSSGQYLDDGAVAFVRGAWRDHELYRWPVGQDPIYLASGVADWGATPA